LSEERPWNRFYQQNCFKNKSALNVFRMPSIDWRML
jgi:hypothetical protein